MICVLAGGVGAAKFLRGLSRTAIDEPIVAIVNTGDDETMYGLRICPDLDTVTYTLGDQVNPTTGWGMRDETYNAQATLRLLGDDPWFTLGDRDLGTHLYRTKRLNAGDRLSEVTQSIATAYGVRAILLPMSESPVATRLTVSLPQPDGVDDLIELSFQEYFVRHRHQPTVHGIRYDAIERADVPQLALDALRSARRIVIAPSNPLLSIGPILAIDAIAEHLRLRRLDTVAVSPIIAGEALKGPAAALLRSLYEFSSVTTVAAIYAEFAARIAIDTRDAAQTKAIQELGVEPLVLPIIMADHEGEVDLARSICFE
ncbi:MAG: 2-phospho-L-lactate transferase [Ferrimicrobium sp.]